MQRSLRRIVSGAFAPVVTRHKVVRGHTPSCTVAGEMGGLTTAGRIGLVPGGTLEQTRNLCERCCTPTAHTHRYSIDLSEFRKMKTDRGSVSPSFRCIDAPGLRHTGLASRRFNNGPERCRGFVSVVVAADPYRAPRRARGTASARIRSGLNRERANGMTSCTVSRHSIRDRATLWAKVGRDRVKCG